MSSEHISYEFSSWRKINELFSRFDFLRGWFILFFLCFYDFFLHFHISIKDLDHLISKKKKVFLILHLENSLRIHILPHVIIYYHQPLLRFCSYCNENLIILHTHNGLETITPVDVSQKIEPHKILCILYFYAY